MSFLSLLSLTSAIILRHLDFGALQSGGWPGTVGRHSGAEEKADEGIGALLVRDLRPLGRFGDLRSS